MKIYSVIFCVLILICAIKCDKTLELKKHAWFQNIKDKLTHVFFPENHQDEVPPETCESIRQAPRQCDETSPYRPYNGSCASLLVPDWGMGNTPFVRLLPARYRDGIEKVATAESGKNLPLARELRTSFFPDKSNEDSIPLINMQWGQFVAHDCAMSAQKEDAKCNCEEDQENSSKCLPIKIPQNDTFHSQHGVTCRNMVRSKVDKSCKTSQINGVTHTMDLSMIYGGTEEVAASLRTFEEGKLKVHRSGNGQFCPHMDKTDKNDCLNSKVCFKAGDVRVNQNIQLTALHALFYREHNRIADELAKINPLWDDEKLYQEARRIVIAEYQHITYNHWLHWIIGVEFIRKKHLYFSEHDEVISSVNVNTLNEFTAAAYRSQHSGIAGILNMYNDERTIVHSINFSDFMNSPGLLVEGNNFEELLLGLVFQKMEQIDDFFTAEVTNKMFHGNKPFGNDLESSDIQRGRDHGMPSYVTALEKCTDSKITSFNDLTQYISEKYVEKLQNHYDSVNDIDLFIGGMLENHVPGARVGPTFLCFIGEQFWRWKFGDRFFYSMQNQAGSFEPEQLNQIRKSSLAAIICENTNIDRITKDVFQLPSDKSNPVAPCSEIPKMNLLYWSDC